MTVVPIQDYPDSPVQIDDIADALDRQIDLTSCLNRRFANNPERTPRSVHQKRAGFS